MKKRASLILIMPALMGVTNHPAMVDPKEALGIKIPLAMLASKDEEEADVKKFEENLTGVKHVEIFKDQVHGVSLPSLLTSTLLDMGANFIQWMGARADLDDARCKSEYERGFKTLIEFFGKHL